MEIIPLRGRQSSTPSARCRNSQSGSASTPLSHSTDWLRQHRQRAWLFTTQQCRVAKGYALAARRRLGAPLSGRGARSEACTMSENRQRQQLRLGSGDNSSNTWYPLAVFALSLFTMIPKIQKLKLPPLLTGILLCVALFQALN